MGRSVPAIMCAVDEKLRAINRGYERLELHSGLISEGVHDGNLLTVALGASLRTIESWCGKPFWKCVVETGYRERAWYKEELNRHPWPALEILIQSV